MPKSEEAIRCCLCAANGLLLISYGTDVASLASTLNSE